MPYKDKEKNREYQRNWARRKKLGLSTRQVPLLTPEERIERHRVSSRKVYRKKSNMIDETWGHACFFCPRTKVRIMHRKDGKPHKLLNELSYKNLERIIEEGSDDYVRLCGICHKGVHWCMNHLNMSWEDVIEHWVL